MIHTLWIMWMLCFSLLAVAFAFLRVALMSVGLCLAVCRAIRTFMQFIYTEILNFSNGNSYVPFWNSTNIFVTLKLRITYPTIYQANQIELNHSISGK
jgi:hypothetical protein